MELTVLLSFPVDDLPETARPFVLHARLPHGESGVNGSGLPQSGKDLALSTVLR